VMEFVRIDGWDPLSRLSYAGSSAQSAESAPVRSRLFNALNVYQLNSPAESEMAVCASVLTDERSDIRRPVEDIAARADVSAYGSSIMRSKVGIGALPGARSDIASCTSGAPGTALPGRA